MFDDLPPDLDRLRTLRTWHQMWLHRIDRKIALLTQRQTEPDRRRARPPTPEWTAEPGTGPGRSPAYVHHGACVLAGPRGRPIGRDEARRLLADGVPACRRCRPDNRLAFLDPGA
ncbi:DUF6233 domain-containing protein [Streptomyces griseofuscus]|uniref:DUF6233 domain-containing protein n=1 Tax=Streptomyces griseofuscus TaxID=146922 RepID=UPI00367C4453